MGNQTCTDDLHICGFAGMERVGCCNPSDRSISWFFITLNRIILSFIHASRNAKLKKKVFLFSSSKNIFQMWNVCHREQQGQWDHWNITPEGSDYMHMSLIWRFMTFLEFLQQKTAAVHISDSPPLCKGQMLKDE